LTFLENSHSNALVDIRKSNLRFSEEEKHAVAEDVSSCKLAAHIRSNQTVKDKTTAIQLVALVAEDEEVQRLTHSLRAMVQGACFTGDASKPPASTTWYEYQHAHIQPHLGQLIRKASMADVVILHDLEENAMKLASDMDYGSEKAFEEACLATLNLMLAKKGTIPRNLACKDVQNSTSCKKKVLPLFEKRMTGKPVFEQPESNIIGKFSLSVVVPAVVIFMALLALLALRKRVWAVLKTIVDKVPSGEIQYEVSQAEPLVSIEEGGEVASAKLAPTAR